MKTVHHIKPCPLPTNALLSAYADSGAYSDCFVTDINLIVTHAEFVEASYTDRLFKRERLLISLLLSKPSSVLTSAIRGCSEARMLVALREFLTS